MDGVIASQHILELRRELETIKSAWMQIGGESRHKLVFSKPAHQWDGTKLRFENPDGTWGEYVELSPDSKKTTWQGGGVSKARQVPKGGSENQVLISSGSNTVAADWTDLLDLLAVATATIATLADEEQDIGTLTVPSINSALNDLAVIINSIISTLNELIGELTAA